MGKLRIYRSDLFTKLNWSWTFLEAAILLSYVSISQSQHHYPLPQARVEFFSLERGTLRIVEDKVNTDVTLTMKPRYFEAYLFQCNASFPVQWSYVGDGAPITTADTGRFFKDFYDVSSYTYQTILYMYTLHELQSGRYVCKGMHRDNENLLVFYNVFVPVDGKEVLLTTAKKTVGVPEAKEYANIPCSVSDSTAEVGLYKGNDVGAFQRLETNESITFNPRKGFKLKMKDLKDPFGNYLCTAAQNSRRRKIQVVPQRLKAYYDPKSSFHGEIPIQFSYDYEYNRMLCCTGTTFVPRLQWAGCTSIVDCQVKSVCFEEDRCEPRLGNSGYVPSKWIDPGPLSPGCAGWKLRDDPNGDMGLFKCSTPGVKQYQPYLLNRGNIFLDFETAPPAEAILSLRKMSQAPIYVGQEFEVHCNGTRFYFSYGFRWAYQRGNGDIEFIDDSTVINDRFFVTAHRRQTVLRIPHADIKAVVCFGPIYNHATEWRTASLPISVQEHIYMPYTTTDQNSALENEPAPQQLPQSYYNYRAYIEDSLNPKNYPPITALHPMPHYDPLENDYGQRVPSSLTDAQVLAQNYQNGHSFKDINQHYGHRPETSSVSLNTDVVPQKLKSRTRHEFITPASSDNVYLPSYYSKIVEAIAQKNRKDNTNRLMTPNLAAMILQSDMASRRKSSTANSDVTSNAELLAQNIRNGISEYQEEHSVPMLYRDSFTSSSGREFTNSRGANALLLAQKIRDYKANRQINSHPQYSKAYAQSISTSNVMRKHQTNPHENKPRHIYTTPSSVYPQLIVTRHYNYTAPIIELG